MLKKVFFVVNDLVDFDFQPHINKYLEGVDVSIGTDIPANPQEYIMVILWNYQRIIKPRLDYKNYIVFHSSDLPHGKGWAPIYYSFFEKQEYYTVTGFMATKEIDAGRVIIKARYAMRNGYVAEMVRAWDNEIMVMLVGVLLEMYSDGVFPSMSQTGEETYRNRRRPQDSEVDINSRLIDILPHLRGCEKEYPAYFKYQDVVYKLYIEPDIKKSFPEDIEIFLPEKNMWENYEFRLATYHNNP